MFAALLAVWGSNQPADSNTQNNDLTPDQPTDYTLSSVASEHSSAPVTTTPLIAPGDDPNTYEIIDQGLKEWVEREVVIANGQWTPSDAELGMMSEAQIKDDSFVQPRLAKLDLPFDLIWASAALRRKLHNIAYFRGDIEVSVRVQASPFVQGVLWLYWAACDDLVSTTRRHLKEHVSSISTLPGVELNLRNPSRSCSLTIPFMSELAWINPLSNFSMNVVTLSVLMGLKGADDSVVANWTMTARLKNTKFYGNIDDQKPVSEAPLLSAGRTMFTEPRTDIISRRIKAQEGEDERATKNGIVSQVSDTIAKVSDTLSGVPVLAPVMKPISWAARAVRGVASMFGWSRPRDLEKNVSISNVPGKGYTHLEGIDNSIALAAIPDNAITHHQTASHLDEMAIPYIAEKPYFLGRVAWTIDDTVNTLIASIPVHPSPKDIMAIQMEVLGKEINVFQGGPISLVSRLFKWWRGNMKLHLNFAKTAYHQGRLMVQYTPYTNGGHGAMDINTVFTEIIDISQLGEDGLEINIPSLMFSKWLSVDGDDTSVSESYQYSNSIAGYVEISVFTPLVATNVAQEVGVYARISWPDIEFAEPGTNLRILPNLYSAPMEIITVKLTDEATITTPGWSSMILNGGFWSGTWKKETTDLWEFIPPVITNNTIVISEFSEISRGITGHEDEITFVNMSEPGHAIYQLELQPFVDYDIRCEGDTVFCVTGDISGIRASGLFIDGFGILVRDSAGYQGYPHYRAHVFSRGGYTAHHTFDGPVTLMAVSYSDVAMGGSIRAQEGTDLTRVTDNSRFTSTMGECVVSLRALTRRATLVSRFNDYFSDVSTGTGQFDTMTQSIVDIISFMYRFYAGSYNYKFVCDGGLVVAKGDTNFNYGSISGMLDSSVATHIQDTRINPVIEVTKPFYSPTEIVLMGAAFDDVALRHFPRTGVSVGGLTSNVSGYCLKAAGDDHTFTFLAGCPIFTTD